MDEWQPLPLWGDERDGDAPGLPARALDRAGVGGQPAHWADAVGVFDLETTGVDVPTDRIVTAHVGLLGPDGAPPAIALVAGRPRCRDP